MDNLGFGLWMTAMGMGTVFGLLVLLMLALRLIGWIDRRSERKRTVVATGAAADAAGAPAVAEAPDALTQEEVAAITIAVITHARVRRLQAAPAMREFEPGSHLFANRWVGIGRGYQKQPWRRGS
jgi:sodium pump decarboxylase gamma subunit